MRVVILCGGEGARLKQETEFKPKPMVEVGKKPILWHIIKTYSHYNFKDFILCLGYKGEMIKEYFYNYEILNNDFTVTLGDHKNVKIHDRHSEKGLSVTLADTGESALKGARIKRIEKYVEGEVFMATYGDGIADINLRDLLAFHRSHGKIGTVTGVRPPSRFGELAVRGNKVASLIEKPQVVEGWINGGFFVFNKNFFSYLSDNDKCDLEFGSLERLAEEGQLAVYKHYGKWACMDTHRDMVYLNKLWENNEAFWKTWDD